MTSARVAAMALVLAATSSNAAPRECMAKFTALRSQVEREGMAARAGGEKRLSRAEMCKLVTAYSGAETTWVRYTEMNMTKCGIPDHIVKQMKTVHAKTNEGLIKLCASGLSLADSREKNPDYRFGPPTQPHDFPPKSLPRVSGR